MPIYKNKNDNFFKKWTPEMAYILGYFAADGTMIKNKRGAHYIELQSTDKELIVGVKKALGSEHKIAAFFRNERWKKIYRIQIGSKEIFNDLLGHGFMPNKSKVLTFPYVPDDYLSHFVRGYFDGDGNVNYCRYWRADRHKYYGSFQMHFISGSKNFLLSLHKRLKYMAGVNGGNLCFCSRGHRLGYSKYDSIRLFLFMYNHMRNGIFLRRKFRYFQKALKVLGYHYRFGPVA